MTHLETLNQQIQRLSAQVAAWRQQLPAAGYNERARLYAFIAHGEDTLAQTKYAYRRANAGQQHLCERCEKPIPPERLAAVPEVTLCIHCAREMENAEAGHAYYLPQSPQINAMSIAA